MSRRSISRIDTPAHLAPGGIGRGHTAVEVIQPTDSSDPFVLLMDDRFDFEARRRIGGAHPHAGLETVTLILEGTLHDRDVGDLAAGDAIWMSAGRGIIHDENVEVDGRVRILQLWIALPTLDRALEPGSRSFAERQRPSFASRVPRPCSIAGSLGPPAPRRETGFPPR